MAWFLLGLFIGASIGLIASAICVAASYDSPTMHDETGLR